MNAVVVLFMFVMTTVVFNVGVLGDHDDWATCAFIQDPSTFCSDEDDLDIMQDWADKKLQRRFERHNDPLFTHYHPEKKHNGGAETGRRLQVCSPNYCARNPTVCILAGCNQGGRRRLSEEDDEEDEFECADVGAGWEEVLNDADEVYHMEAQSIELTEGTECDLSKLWFVIYLEDD